jgi:hypothetical protein
MNMSGSWLKKGWLSNLILLVLSVFLSMVIVFSFYTLKAYKFYQNHPSLDNGGTYFVYDPLLGYAPSLNVRASFVSGERRFELLTDNIGARIASLSSSSTGKVDILGVGCSFTWGDNVDYKDAYLNVIAQKTGLSVSNIAMPSYGTTSAFLSLRKFVHLKPRVVIYGLIEDHLVRNLIPCARCDAPFCRATPFVDFDPAPYIHPPRSFLNVDTFEYSQSFLARHKFGLIDVKWAFLKDVFSLTKHMSSDMNEKYDLRAEDLAYQKAAFQFLIEQMVDLCKKNGIKLVVVYIPDPDSIFPPPAPIRTLSKYVDGKDVFFVDLTQSFLEYARRFGKKSLLSLDGKDSHPSEVAHSLIADKILPIIKFIYSQ